MRKLWERLDRPAHVALVSGAALTIASVPLPTWLALLVGLAAALVLGYSFPNEHVRVGVLVAAPILAMTFLLGLLRGIGMLTLGIVLGCSLILPVGLARLGAGVRIGPTARTPR